MAEFLRLPAAVGCRCFGLKVSEFFQEKKRHLNSPKKVVRTALQNSPGKMIGRGGVAVAFLSLFLNDPQNFPTEFRARRFPSR